MHLKGLICYAQDQIKETLENVNALQNGLIKRGFDIGATQLCNTVVRGIHPTMAWPRLEGKLRYFCSIVVYPVIPKGLILLRLIPTATHSIEDVEITLNAFAGIREKLENGTYKRLSELVKSAT